MTTALLDSNVFDKLVQDDRACDLLRKLRAEGTLSLVVSVTTPDELAAAPNAEILLSLLKELSIDVLGNATPVADIMRAGDYLGEAEHYFKHKGQSTKGTNDALIAAAAQFHADWLVSGDGRLRRRLSSFGATVKPLDYGEFLAAISAL